MKGMVLRPPRPLDTTILPPFFSESKEISMFKWAKNHNFFFIKKNGASDAMEVHIRILLTDSVSNANCTLCMISYAERNPLQNVSCPF